MKADAAFSDLAGRSCCVAVALSSRNINYT